LIWSHCHHYASQPASQPASDTLILAEYFGLNMEKELDRNYFPEFSAKTEAELKDYT